MLNEKLIQEFGDLWDEVLHEIKIDANTKLILEPLNNYFLDKKGYLWDNNEDQYFLLVYSNLWSNEEYNALNPKNFHPRAYWDELICLDPEYVKVVDKLKEIKIDAIPKLYLTLKDKNFLHYEDNQGGMWGENPAKNYFWLIRSQMPGSIYDDLNPKQIHPHAYKNEHGAIIIKPQYVKVTK